MTPIYTTIEDLNVSDSLQHILRTDAQARRVMARWLAALAPNKAAGTFQAGAFGRCLGCGAKQDAHYAERCPPKNRGPDINRILRVRPRDAARGAPMGATNRDERDSNARVYCQRVHLVDGGYGPDGTYWGMGHGLWAVFTADLALLWYVRATTRTGAVSFYLQDNPRARKYGRPKA